MFQLAAFENVVGAVTGAIRTATPFPTFLSDARGLLKAEMEAGVELRPIIIPPILGVIALGGVELVPGEETPVSLSVPGLPPNADVKTLRVKMNVAATLTQPEADESKVSVSAGGAEPQTFTVGVTPSALPRNVQVRLNGGEPVWSHTGPLEAGDHELPDLAAAVNTFLDLTPQPPGQGSTLSFLVRSETPGRVSFAVVENSLDYTLLQTQTWDNPLDQSVRIDRNLELDFGRVHRIPLDELAGGGTAMKLAGVRMDLSGEAGAERLLGDVPAHDGREFATVSSDYALAQAFSIPSGGSDDGLGFPEASTVRVAGVSLLAEVDGPGELYVEVQRDAGGAPASEPPLGSVTFEVAPPEGPPGAKWVYAALPEPAEVPVDTGGWIVLRGIRGSVRVALEDPPPAGWRGLRYLQGVLVNRGGQVWKPLKPSVAGTAALMRVAYLPEPDNQTAPIAIGFEGQSAQRPELSQQVQRLQLPAAGTAPVLQIVSHARGTLALANVVQEFGR